MKCKDCKGTGEIIMAFDKFSHSSIVCSKCNGTGQDNKEHIEIKKITMEEVVKRFEALDFWKWEHQEGYMQAYKDLGLIKE